jgi:elongation factor G
VPLYGLALHCKRGQEQKLSTALHKLDMEDPCLNIEHDPVLNQTVMRGLGELHLRIALERMRNEYNLDIRTEPPKIPYRETISRDAKGWSRHKKQTGGAGQFGEVFLRIAPLARGAGFEFIDEVTGGAIPKSLIAAARKGIQQVLDAGAIAGYPLQDLQVTVYNGKTHTVDSKEIAFVTAGRKALLDAITKAGPLLLEPLVSLDVTVLGHDMGAITGDLAAKRGRIHGSNTLPEGKVRISAEVPLAALVDYPTELKSLSGGRGSYALELSHYEPVPDAVQRELIAAYRPREEED